MRRCNKILLLIVISIISIFASVKVVNAEEIVGFAECKYVLGTHGSLHRKANGSPIYISFTEIKQSGSTNHALKARKSVSDSFQDLTAITKYFSTDKNLVAGNSFNSFQNAVKTSNGCPKYMTIEKSEEEGKKTLYNALFYSDLKNSARCNGTLNGTSLCNAIFKLDESYNNVYKIDPNEEQWTISGVSGSKAYDNRYQATEYAACSDLNVKLTIKDMQFNVTPSYGPNTQYSAAKSGGLTIQGNVTHNFNDIAKLITSNKVDYFAIMPTATVTVSTFLEDPYSCYNCSTSNSCKFGVDEHNIEMFAVFTRDSICARSTELSNVIRNLKEKASSIYPTITRSEYGKYYKTGSDGKKTGINFASSNQNVAYYQKIIDDINNVIKDIPEDEVNDIMYQYDSLINGTHAVNYGKVPCEDVKKQIQLAKEEFGTISSTYDELSNALRITSANAMNRLKEIKAEKPDKVIEEEINKYEKIVENIEETVENNSRIVEKVNSRILDGMNFEFGVFDVTIGNCGVLSQDMRDFLNIVLWYIRIAGLVLAIILSFMDYIKAAAGSDDKSMNAANKKVIMRIIFVAILFLIPALLGFVLDILNISTTAGSLTCIK